MVWFVCLSSCLCVCFFFSDLMSFYLLFLNNESKMFNMHRVHYGSRDDLHDNDTTNTNTIGYAIDWELKRIGKTSCILNEWTIHHPKVVIQFLTHFGHITKTHNDFSKWYHSLCMFIFPTVFYFYFLRFSKRMNRFSTLRRVKSFGHCISIDM